VRKLPFFIFYSTDSEEEKRFKEELATHNKIDFMGDVDYFPCTAFIWLRHDKDNPVSVHLTQTVFTEFSAHRFGVDRMRVPNMTPYRSGISIDSIPSPDPSDPDLPRRTKVYQRIVGSINWLATGTRPNISPVFTFLALYSTQPSHQHYKAAIHALKYLYSASEYGISYHSDACSTLQAFNHFPHHRDKETYNDATPPPPSESHNLTAFSDTCWGGQFGNAVADETPLELFKFRALSGYVIYQSRGPIAWKSIRQEQTAQSLCKANILATNECVKELLDIRNRAVDMGISDGVITTRVYNDNQVCVIWAASCAYKGTKHINLQENKV